MKNGKTFLTTMGVAATFIQCAMVGALYAAQPANAGADAKTKEQ